MNAPATPDTKPHVIKRVLLPLIIVSAIVLGKLIGGNEPHEAVKIFGLKLDFILFGGTLIFVALSHKLKWETRDIALSGLGLVLAHQLYMGTDLAGHLAHDNYHEVRGLSNLGGLLPGFAVVSACFTISKFGDWLPAILPDDWKGPACLLTSVLILSAFLDNIAAAMIGGVIAREVFKGKVTVGFLAAIVACSNAGGAPSIIGDTTTTMLWIDGVSPLDVTHAGMGTLGAGAVIVYFGARQQDRHQRILKDPEGGLKLSDVKWSFLICVLWALIGCLVGNLTIGFPAVGVWVGLLVGAFMVGFREMPFAYAGHIVKETIFILSLVAMASLMPVNDLPPASEATAFVLGFVSAVFDNIPLTKLCLAQGGYDWGVLAYAVGFGGSMLWFGSSAGVALCSEFAEGKNVWAWVKQGWFVPVGYVVGFLLMIGTVGWHPHEPHRTNTEDGHGAAAVTSEASVAH